MTASLPPSTAKSVASCPAIKNGTANAAERQRMADDRTAKENWRHWGPYVSERQWGTVREDYSPGGDAWEYFPHDHARSRAYPDVARSLVHCSDGANSCPPEDVGGTDGYTEFLEVIADPDHEEHDRYLTCVGGHFDPKRFDLDATNLALSKIRA